MPLPGAKAEQTLSITGSSRAKRQRLSTANSPNYSVACTPSLAPTGQVSSRTAANNSGRTSSSWTLGPACPSPAAPCSDPHPAAAVDAARTGSSAPPVPSPGCDGRSPRALAPRDKHRCPWGGKGCGVFPPAHWPQHVPK